MSNLQFASFTILLDWIGTSVSISLHACIEF